MPGEGRVGAALRRRRERAVLVASGLVDRSWVQAQVGHPLEDDAALAAYLADPALSPHPLVELDWVDPGRPWVGQGRSGLAWYLADPDHRVRSTHPLLSLAGIEEQVPGARQHPHGPVAAWLAHVGSAPSATLPTRPGTPPLTLGQVREAAVEALARHRDGTAAPTAPDGRVPGRVRVVVATGEDVARTVNWLRSVGETRRQGTDVEVVTVGGPVSRTHRVLADTVAAAYDVAPVVVTGAALTPDRALALGVACSRGERLVLVRPGVVPDGAAALR
ncbi:MAG: hypothetical protein LH468_02685, partial [Nocardioides sp.]|nr:hypothetical protein [Nocardioides sp.]